MSIGSKTYDIPNVDSDIDDSSDDDEVVRLVDASKRYDHPMIHNIPDVDSDIVAAVNEFIRKCESSDDPEVRFDATDDLNSYIEQKEIPMSMVLVLCNFALGMNSGSLMSVFCGKFGDLVRAMKPDEVQEVRKLISSSYSK